MSEQWRAVLGYEGSYEVSDLGRVRSLTRVTHDGKHLRGQILAPFVMPTGHIRVSLARGGKGLTKKVHRLVLFAFVGPSPEGMECLHRDGNPANNALTNLRWGTKSENSQDQLRHGTHPAASKTHCPAGHPYDEANTYRRRATNHRQCRTCVLAQQKAAYHAKKKVAA